MPKKKLYEDEPVSEDTFLDSEFVEEPFEQVPFEIVQDDEFEINVVEPLNSYEEPVVVKGYQSRLHEAPVFTATQGKAWLKNTAKRRKAAYLSLRFEPEGLEGRELSFVLRLLVRATMENGLLYVPVALAYDPVLDGLKLERLPEEEGYVPIRVK